MKHFTLPPYKAAALLLLVSILAFMPGISNLPVLDRDEARFAQASRQMMYSHEYVDIRFQDEARHKKPVGIYWAQVITSKAFDEGNHEEIWPFRVPSFLGAIFAVLFTFWGARAVLSTSGAFTAGLILASSILLMAEARIAKTDASLLFTICMAQAFFVHIYQAFRETRTIPHWHIIGFWLAIGGGILLKGPITPLVLIFTIFGLCWAQQEWRLLKALKPLWGAGIVLAMCAPWFIAITIKSNGAFFAESVGKDLAAKVVSGQEKHGAPPLTYFALLPVLFWPWAGVFLASIGQFWRARGQWIIQWLFFWSIPLWVMFELIPTKLPHYILPALPAFAIGLALLWEENRIPTWKTWQKLLLCLPPIIGIAVFGAAAYAMQFLEGTLQTLPLIGFALAALVSVMACRAFWYQNLSRAIVYSTASGIVISSTILAVFLPNMPSLFLSERIREAVLTHGCAYPTTALTGYYEPSVVFRLHGDTVQLKADEILPFLQKPPEYNDEYHCHVAVIDSQIHPKTPQKPSPETVFLQQAAQAGITPRKLATVKGRNMNGGRERHLSVWMLK